MDAWEESWHVVLKLWTIKRLGLTPRSVCLWERAWGSEGKLWLAAQANQSKLQSIWEICLTAKQAFLVNLRLYYSSSTDYWTIKVGFASTVQLKDAQGLKGNAIRSEKNLIFCFPTRCQDVRCDECKMPSRQEPNLELTGKICELLPAQRPAFLRDVSPH